MKSGEVAEWRSGKVRVKTFRDLVAWQKAMKLAEVIYRETQAMPREEVFGLTSQMRRAATSVPMNIAEGFGRWTRPAFLLGLRVAMGSLFELMTAYELATNLGMLKQSPAVKELLAEEDRLLQALIRSLEKKTEKEERKPKRSI